jgi:hypothetical protein
VDFLEGDIRVNYGSKTDYGVESDMGTARVHMQQVGLTQSGEVRAQER